MKTFANRLLKWYSVNARELPWRETKDPYKIWISEIILQQTRVAQGKSYYINFVKLFPSVMHLANASSDKVMKAWEGLGYYSRARNLHSAAKTIVKEYNGKFPTTFEEIIQLKGIGIYTASAIASIAFNETKAAVDGNVYRVLSRLFGISEPIDSANGKKIFQELANKLIHPKHPGDYNQALMEFGATVCVPKNPNCLKCTFSEDCLAFRQGKVSIYPIKGKKTKINLRYLNYALFIYKNKLLVRRREEKDIWKNLYEFYLYSIEQETTALKSNFSPVEKQVLPLEKIISVDHSEIMKHQLSHQTIYCRVSLVRVNKRFSIKGFKWVELQELNKLAFPRLLERFLTREGFLLPQKNTKFEK